MTRTISALAASVPTVLVPDRSRKTGSHDSRKTQTVIRDGSPGSRHRARTYPDQSRGDSETVSVSLRFFPNHCVDPTASGLVAPALRLSPAVDHAGRSTEDAVRRNDAFCDRQAGKWALARRKTQRVGICDKPFFTSSRRPTKPSPPGP